MAVGAEGGVKRRGGETAEEGADGDVDGADAGEAKDVVAEAEGDDVGEADGHDDEEAVVAEFFVEVAEPGALGFQFFVDIFSRQPVGEISGDDGGEGVTDLRHDDAADQAETIAGEDLQPPDRHGDDGHEQIYGQKRDNDEHPIGVDPIVKSMRVMAQVVALSRAKKKNGAADGHQDEENKDEQASYGGEIGRASCRERV